MENGYNQNEFEKILFSEADLKRIVSKMAEKINDDYQGKELVVIGMLKGAAPFMMDLIKEIKLPIKIDFMQASSYFDGTSPRDLIIKKDIDIDIVGKHVLLLDDIIDSGITMTKIMNLFKNRKAASIKTGCLLDKPSGRKVNLKADYVGTLVPNGFIVGYGLDYNECYRNLPFIAVLSPSVYNK